MDSTLAQILGALYEKDVALGQAQKRIVELEQQLQNQGSEAGACDTGPACCNPGSSQGTARSS